VDGRRVANPLRIELEPTARKHRVVARARGYRPARRRIRFNDDVQTTLRLQRAPSSPNRASDTSSSPQRSGDQRSTAGFVTDNPY
jgi:hypothetical protein